ncbi:DnaJ- protein scj1 [Coemansia sp. BCRC 34490]|nr:DnaJ- protein scj1 [Coemansia sp. BCRC 34490]
MRDGEEITFEGEGDQHPDHEPGSVVVRLVQQRHAIYERHGDNLHAEVTVTLLDALVGFNRTIRHVDGKSDIDLRRQGVTPPGFVQTLPGKGMPRRGQTGRERAGDVRVTYWIQFPLSVSESEKVALASLFGGWDDAKWDGSSAKAAARAATKGSSSVHDEL